MSTGLYNFTYVTKVATGVTIIGVLISYLKKFRGGFGWTEANVQFNWHPLLMVLGLVFLYSESILIYRSARYYISKKTEKIIHATIHLAAFVLAVIGLQAAFDSHNKSNYKNLYSIHSWIGLTTVIIFAAQFLSGFIAFLFPGLDGSIRKGLLPLHVFFGTFAFIMATITSISGITEVALFYIQNYESLPPEAQYINWMGMLLILYACLTLYLLFKPEFKRKPLPED